MIQSIIPSDINILPQIYLLVNWIWRHQLSQGLHISIHYLHSTYMATIACYRYAVFVTDQHISQLVTSSVLFSWWSPKKLLDFLECVHNLYIHNNKYVHMFIHQSCLIPISFMVMVGQLAWYHLHLCHNYCHNVTKISNDFLNWQWTGDYFLI